jgi:hypothetical protein
MMLFHPDIVPVRIAGLLQTLCATGPIARSRLDVLLLPPSTRGDSKPKDLLDPLVNATLRLGLIRSTHEADPVMTIHPKLVLPQELHYEDCLQQISNVLFDKESFSESTTNPMDGRYQFGRLLAWSLDQPLTRLPGTLEEWKAKWNAISGGEFEALETKSFEQFIHWGQTLGLLMYLNLARKEDVKILMVNPTPFLRRHLADFMTTNTPMTAPDWLQKLGESYPIFDGGWMRQKIRASEDQILSASLSLAVRQLADEGSLNLEDRKDAPRLRLRLGRTEQSFSHLTRMGGGK